jgi:hypothetical protein
MLHEQALSVAKAGTGSASAYQRYRKIPRSFHRLIDIVATMKWSAFALVTSSPRKAFHDTDRGAENEP